MIYLITCQQTNCCKIGYSKEPGRRLLQLQTANAHPLVLETVIDGDTKKEHELHVQFRHYRLEGEWFSYGSQIKKYFGIDQQIMFRPDQLLANWDKVSKITTKSLQLFYALLQLSDDNLIHITTSIRSSIRQDLSMSSSEFSRCLLTLAEATLIHRIENKVWLINPDFYGNYSTVYRNLI